MLISFPYCADKCVTLIVIGARAAGRGAAGGVRPGAGPLVWPTSLL